MLQLEFWISELAQKTGVSVRTIRYYVDEGLLPQPEVRGKYAVFHEGYLERLELIKQLKDAYLPLKEIRSLLNSMNDAEISLFLQRFRTDPDAARSSLNRLRSRPSDESMLRDNAEEYITRVMHKGRPEMPAPEMDKLMFMSQEPPKVNRLVNTSPERETWQRIELAPGIELHYREPLNSSRRRRMNQLVELIIQLLQKEGGI